MRPANEYAAVKSEHVPPTVSVCVSVSYLHKNMKATAKTNTKAATTVAAKINIIVPASVKAEIATAANAEGGAMAAATKRDETILNLGITIKRTLGKLPREDVQKALKPLFVDAYAKVGRAELYAGQQLSRVLQKAYATAEAETVATALLVLKKKGAKVSDNGSERRVNVNDVYKALTGGAKLKGNRLVTVKKSNRGGKNKKTPAETFKFNVGNSITAAKTAKMKGEAQAVAIVEAFTANEYDLDDVREWFEAALQD